MFRLPGTWALERRRWRFRRCADSASSLWRNAGPAPAFPFLSAAGHDVGFSMRLITFTAANAAPRIGVRVGHRILDIEAASRVDGEPLPSTMRALLAQGRGALSRV